MDMKVPLEFPCKDQKEKTNTTLEGLSDKERQGGSPDRIEDIHDDDDDDDGDDDGDDGRPPPPPPLERPPDEKDEIEGIEGSDEADKEKRKSLDEVVKASAKSSKASGHSAAKPKLTLKEKKKEKKKKKKSKKKSKDDDVGEDKHDGKEPEDIASVPIYDVKDAFIGKEMDGIYITNFDHGLDGGVTHPIPGEIGHDVKLADAIQAYIQATLTGPACWVELPEDAWREEVDIKKFRRPVVRLVKALHGRPDAGTMREQKCDTNVRELGFMPVGEEWPSMYFHPKMKLLLAIYVGDLKMSGPSENLAKGWALLRTTLNIEPETDLGLYLGCVLSKGKSKLYDGTEVATMTYDMEGLLRQSVEKYLDIVGKDTKLKKVATPSLPEDTKKHPARAPVKGNVKDDVQYLWCSRQFDPKHSDALSSKLPESDVNPVEAARGALAPHAARKGAVDGKQDYWQWEQDGKELVRVHVIPRRQMFVPNECGDCPCDVGLLTDGRNTTIRFQKYKRIVPDDWRFAGNNVEFSNERNEFWTGTTRFCVMPDPENTWAEPNQRDDIINDGMAYDSPKGDSREDQPRIAICRKTKGMKVIGRNNMFVACHDGIKIVMDHRNRIVLNLHRKDGEVLHYSFDRSVPDVNVTEFIGESAVIDLHELPDNAPCLLLMCAEPVSLFTELVPNMKRLKIHLETLTEDGDLFSEHGKAKWRRCVRSRSDCVFFAGPCAGGSPWNRLNMRLGETTAHIIKMKATIFWKLLEEFLQCLLTIIKIDGMALMELPRGCDYWRDHRIRDVLEGSDANIHGFWLHVWAEDEIRYPNKEHQETMEDPFMGGRI
eukprot:s503_g7.t1